MKSLSRPLLPTPVCPRGNAGDATSRAVTSAGRDAGRRGEAASAAPRYKRLLHADHQEFCFFASAGGVRNLLEERAEQSQQSPGEEHQHQQQFDSVNRVKPLPVRGAEDAHQQLSCFLSALAETSGDTELRTQEWPQQRSSFSLSCQGESGSGCRSSGQQCSHCWPSATLGMAGDSPATLQLGSPRRESPLHPLTREQGCDGSAQQRCWTRTEVTWKPLCRCLRDTAWLPRLCHLQEFIPFCILHP